MNTMVNTSVILISTMMDAFTQVVVSATSAMASGMAEAMGGEGTEKQVTGEMRHKLPEVDEKMKAMISDLKKDIYIQMEQKRKEIEPLLSGPEFEVGPQIIEKYTFKLPKLTQELDDNSLAQYSQLLVSGDPTFAQMFKELVEWLNSLPKLHQPATVKKNKSTHERKQGQKSRTR
jgi:hypothetical protein